MKPLLLLIITIVFSFNVYAEPKELDREKYNYYCHWNDIEVDKHGNTGCKGIKTGDLLFRVPVNYAALYCNKNNTIIQNESGNSVTCLYNGKPIKKMKSLK
jgi:hypothetical protein